jgi:hypothetical protein
MSQPTPADLASNPWLASSAKPGVPMTTHFPFDLRLQRKAYEECRWALCIRGFVCRHTYAHFCKAPCAQFLQGFVQPQLLRRPGAFRGSCNTSQVLATKEGVDISDIRTCGSIVELPHHYRKSLFFWYPCSLACCRYDMDFAERAYWTERAHSEVADPGGSMRPPFPFPPLQRRRGPGAGADARTLGSNCVT